MYRDILQHNVLDLFRDLLLEPSLTAEQLRRFVAYIYEQSGDVLQVLSADYCSAQFLSQMKQTSISFPFSKSNPYVSDQTTTVAGADRDATHSNNGNIALNISLTADECLHPSASYDKDDTSSNQYQSLAQHSPCTPNTTHCDDFHFGIHLQPVASHTSTSRTSTTTTTTSTTATLTHAQSSPTLSETYVSNSISLHARDSDEVREQQQQQHEHTTTTAGHDTDVRLNSLSVVKPTTWFNRLPKLKPKHQRSLSQFSAWLNALKPGHGVETVEQKYCQNDDDVDELHMIQDADSNGADHCEEDDDDDDETAAGDVVVDNDDHFGIHSVYELLDRLNTEEFKYGRDNGKYLISNSHRILDDEFEPTFADLLHCHVRSTGLMFENHIQCKALPVDAYDRDTHTQCKQDIVFKLVDVGGHRNERKKWQHVLSQDNDVIVFIASATAFCQCLFEDFKANAMQESLEVWTEIVSDARYNHRHGQSGVHDTQFVLVINKIDLFYERYGEFKRYFPDYDGDVDDKHEILAYIKSLYLDIAAEYGRTNIHCICTKMTDIHDVGCFEIENVRHILFNYQQEMLNADIVDTILAYSVGDQFWSEQWLKPMWQNKLRKIERLNEEKRQQELVKKQNSRLSLQRIQQFMRSHDES